MKIRKVEELVDSLLDKKDYVIHNRNFKKSLNHGLLLKKLHTVIKFKSRSLVEPCIDMITYIRENSKTDFEKKNIFKLMNNTVFRKKTMENVRKHGDVELVRTKAKMNY